MEALKPGDPGVVGRYRLSARLAQGRLGAVFLGKAADGGPVAVRLVRPDLAADPKFVERFRKNMAAVRKVDGPHLAHVLDADADGTPPWLVTEYAPGVPLDAAVREHGPLPEESLRALGSALARALVAVHAAKTTHQGLATSVVVLTADGPQITDLGVPPLLGADARTGLPAPEQATGGTVGAPTDVFALAGLVCAAGGVEPYGPGTQTELAQKVLRSTPDLDGLPEDLRDVVGRCFARRPDARPTAAELVELFDGEDATDTGWLPKPFRAAVADAVKAAAASDAVSVKTPSTGGASDKTGKADKTGKSDKSDGPAKAGKAAAGTKPAADADKGPKNPKDSEAKTAEAAVVVAPDDAKAGGEDKKKDKDAGESQGKDGESETVEVEVSVAVQGSDGKAEPDEASSDDDATPVATPALPRQADGKRKNTPKPSGGSAEGKDADKDKAGDADPDEDDATPVATPALPAPKGGGKASTPAAAAPTVVVGRPGRGNAGNGKKAEPAPGAAPTVPAKRPAEPAAPTVVAKKPVSAPSAGPEAAPEAAAPTVVTKKPIPSPSTSPEAAPDRGAAAETVVVPERPLDQPQLIKARPTAAAVAQPAAPAAAPVTAPVADPTLLAQPFPAAVPVETPRPAKREASDAVWYAVIALVGATSAGLAVFRVVDSDWRELQNPVMGWVLPAIAFVCGLAGLVVLALAVSSRSKQKDTEPPRSTAPPPRSASRSARMSSARRRGVLPVPRTPPARTGRAGRPGSLCPCRRRGPSVAGLPRCRGGTRRWAARRAATRTSGSPRPRGRPRRAGGPTSG
ncbi:serine/threonine-protein kinase [Yinghuangia seranimata]|uniref:serine/threonine-protein kinase n=1 Tax=Yinghuangia seranimata TaxID=408067 RepID=UPI00248BE48C|nr:protein kinase [Yinghuangia seranimata]MDI2126084.1 protein kinase [Yinghuangia seranimata]